MLLAELRGIDPVGAARTTPLLLRAHGDEEPSAARRITDSQFVSDQQKYLPNAEEELRNAGPTRHLQQGRLVVVTLPFQAEPYPVTAPKPGGPQGMSPTEPRCRQRMEARAWCGVLASSPSGQLAAASIRDSHRGGDSSSPSSFRSRTTRTTQRGLGRAWSAAVNA